MLFVLKNLLNQEPFPPPRPENPPPEPENRPPGPRLGPGSGLGSGPEPGTLPKIKLPKALISNIKQLLHDQKQVQNVIEQMKLVVAQTVPNLVSDRVANVVSTSPHSNLLDSNSPLIYRNQLNSPIQT